MTFRMSILIRLGSLVLISHCLTTQTGAADKLRVGIIGLDTSHVIAFTQAINNPQAEWDVAAQQ